MNMERGGEMSKLTFKEIKEKCVSGETVLITEDKNELTFIGFRVDGKLVTESETTFMLDYTENEIKEWIIKTPTREVIELFLTETFNGTIRTCDKDGKSPNYEHKEMTDTEATMYRTNRSKDVFRRIYADTFEGVEE